MARDAIFAGTVAGSITATSFTVNAGSGSPNWTASAFVYAHPGQRETYYAEFTSGALRGLYYKVTANGTNSLTLDTEGDSLLSHAFNGSAPVALLAGDGVKIRPYFRIRDVFENPAASGTPILEGRPTALNNVGDEVKFTSYTGVGINKAATLTVYYITNTNTWSSNAAQSGQPTTVADWVLRPNEAFMIKNRNAGSIELTNTGWVVMNKMISFIPGGSAVSGNDIYISINRPAPVKLNQSGLADQDPVKSFLKHSTGTLSPQRQDELITWPAGTGFNRAATLSYVYVGAPTNGWRQVGSSSTTIGEDILLQPGQAYILRKKANSVGKDWINDANY